MATIDSSNTPEYAAPTAYLQQGDIFRQDVVTPVVDTQKRLFRTADGRHGSAVFDEGVSAHIFDEEELRTHLGTCTRTALHTAPFQMTEDGHPELVIVHSHLTSFFIIATQTCDVSGEDKLARPTAIILPIITVFDICRRECMPFKLINTELTVQEFFELHAQDTTLGQQHDPFHYPAMIRLILAQWVPPTKNLTECRNQIRNFLERMSQHGWMYFLKQDEGFQVPESYVDFSVAYTVPTSRLNALKDSRIARINNPYREQFAQGFATSIGRIAVPTPMKPDKYEVAKPT